MLDTLQWLLIVLPVALGAAMGSWPKRFEKVGYRIAVGIFCVLYSVGTYVEIVKEKKAAADVKQNGIDTPARVSAELTKQYTDTVASQALKIAELEGIIQSQSKNVRDVKKNTVAIWKQTDTGKQKRKNVIEYANERIKQADSILKYSSSVGLPGSGGSPAEQFTEKTLRWTTEVGGYLLGSLGQSCADRFNQAGYPGHVASTPRTGIRS